jgi:predicted amidohydrolase YtcJ
MSSSEIAFTTSQADTAFVNGKIVTVNSRMMSAKRCRSVVTEFYASEIVLTLKNHWIDTRVVNLNGRTLIPGFIENHIHMTNPTAPMGGL